MLTETLRKYKILPAVTFELEEYAPAVAEALLKGGLKIMEVPYRTSAASAAVKIIIKRFPEMTVGAGTLLNTQQLHEAIDAGASFGLSPGFNRKIVEEAARLQFPFIPGIMTPSEMEAAFEMGCQIQKLFPAEQVEGPKFLKALLSPYAQLNIQFIPMGGVNIQNMKEYLSLKNVIAVGGSWLATKQLIADKDFRQIELNAKQALEIT